MAIEQTFFALKPDGLKYSLTGYVLTMMSRTQLVYAASKVVRVSDLLAREHYAEHVDKPFFEDLVKYIKGELHYRGAPGHEQPFTEDYRRVLAIVYHGPKAISEVRKVVGPTSPINARQENPGTIRAMGAIYELEGATDTLLENIVHASANPEDAQREIELWFTPHEIPEPMRIFPVVQAKNFFFVSPDFKVYTDPKPNTKCLVSPGDPLGRRP